jgi:hypothetical protein
MPRRLIQFIFILTALLFAMDAKAGIIIKPVHNFGLVGYWDFQEGAGNNVYDKTGYDNDGTWTGAGSHWANGKIGQGGNFNGTDDYVNTNTEMDIDGMTELSICVWIYWAPADITKDGVIVSKWDDADTGMMMWVDDVTVVSGRTDTITLGIKVSEATGARVEGSTGILTPQTWNHFCGTFKGSTFIRLYKNGVLDQEVTATYASVEASTANVRIGRGSYTPEPRYFDGKIDEVRIYNRALSASEVERLYKLSQPKMLAPPSTGLVGYWSFDEGSGTKVGDFSGQGNTGTWNGAGSHWTDGKFGKGGYFNGSDDYVEVLHTSIGNPSGSFTITAWAKISSFGSDFEGIIVKQDNYIGYYIEYYRTDNCIQAGLADGSNENRIPGSSWSLNEWHFVTLSYNAVSDIVEFFDNAVSQGTLQEPSPVYTTHDLWIGASEKWGNWFNGTVDEVRIYNRALETSEITALYNSGLTKINASQNNQITNGLVGFWSFNGPDIDGNEAYDRSGQGNTGTITGATKTIGQVGQALSFDWTDGSTDNVLVPYASNLNITGPISISAWVKPRSFAGNDYIGFVEKDYYTTSYYFGTGTRSGSLANLDFWYGGTLVVGTTNLPLVLNQWQHVAVSYTGAGADLYLNGVNIKHSDTVATPGGNPNELNIGLRDNDNQSFNGLMDEVRVYNRALSAQEILRLYNLGR